MISNELNQQIYSKVEKILADILNDLHLVQKSAPEQWKRSADVCIIISYNEIVLKELESDRTKEVIKNRITERIQYIESLKQIGSDHVNKVLFVTINTDFNTYDGCRIRITLYWE